MALQADINFENELWQTAVTLRGAVSPADYKHYVLPLLFLRYISLRYEQLKLLLKEAGSDYYTGDPEMDAEVLEQAKAKWSAMERAAAGGRWWTI